MINYLFYRLARWFYKEDGPVAIRATLAISIISSTVFILIAYMALCLIFGNAVLTRNWMSAYQQYIFISVIMVWVSISICSFLYYRNKYFAFDKRWHNETSLVSISKTTVLIVIYITIMYLSFKFFVRI